MTLLTYCRIMQPLSVMCMLASRPSKVLKLFDDELVLEFDAHAGGEGNPQGLSLDHSVPESARSEVEGYDWRVQWA